jgi:hypothetical protein
MLNELLHVVVLERKWFIEDCLHVNPGGNKNTGKSVFVESSVADSGTQFA